jgi:hypothetical protein
MKMHRSQRRPIAALVLGASALLGAMAAHAVYNPPIQMDNGIEYMSGGVNGDEAELMQTIEPRWPASFEFAVKGDRTPVLASAVVVTIRDASGRPLLSKIASGGPILVARLDPGHYEVEATLGGQVQKQQVEVLPGHSSHTVFVWPSGTDVSAHS